LTSTFFLSVLLSETIPHYNILEKTKLEKWLNKQTGVYRVSGGVERGLNK
jgi:hypothetical protein